MRALGRRVLSSREKIAAVAALSQGAHSAKSQAVTLSAALRSIRWRPDFLAPECRAKRNLRIPAGETLFAGGSFDGRDSTGKQTGLRLMRSQGPA